MGSITTIAKLRSGNKAFARRYFENAILREAREAGAEFNKVRVSIDSEWSDEDDVLIVEVGYKNKTSHEFPFSLNSAESGHETAEDFARTFVQPFVRENPQKKEEAR